MTLSVFRVLRRQFWGIADNVINGSLLDTLVQKLKKLMMNISNKTVRLKKSRNR